MVLRTISSETEYNSDRGVDIYGGSYVAAACGVKFLSNLFCFVCEKKSANYCAGELWVREDGGKRCQFDFPRRVFVTAYISFHIDFRSPWS